MAEEAVQAGYDGPLKLGMVFDFEPGKPKHLYERLTITRLEGPHIWAYGKSGETYYDEADFRKKVVFVADKPLLKPRPVPVALTGRYEGPIDVGMFFDFEPGKKHLYERICIMKREGIHIWARGRGGESYYEEDEFRDRAAPVPSADR